jgi:His/Glu/Gln/Arg/opine family amino acid ABC transporter permease subunit
MTWSSYFADLAEYLTEWIPQLLEAAGNTIRMAALALCLAASFGLVLALARLSRSRLLAGTAAVYVELVRGAPALTLLFLIYFGLPSVGIVLPAFQAAVIGLGLNGAAYVSEIYRAGIGGIDRGQREAAQAIGMTYPKVMGYVILPQAAKIVLPPLGNYAIGLLKDTSVASLIGAPELTLRARDLSSEYFMPMEIYLVSGAMYFAMAAPLAAFVRWLERRLRRGR